MSAVSVAEMIEAEKRALANGWTEGDLLELAGDRLGHAIGRFFPTPGTAVGFLGKGHNAGDTLVALSVLRDTYGWHVGIRTSHTMEDCAPLLRVMAERHGPFPSWESGSHHGDRRRPLLLLDGLLGSGTRGGIRPPLLDLADEMNRLRDSAGARIAAVDLPTGIDPDRGTSHRGAVRADVTFTIGNPKRGLLRSSAVSHVGALVLVGVAPLFMEGSDRWSLVTPSRLKFRGDPRAFEFHKGDAGRVSIIAGSPQYTGAAALAATGALRAGAGLVTVHTPEAAVHGVTSRCPPEIIVRGYRTPREAMSTPHDALVIGCGMGAVAGTDENDLLECIRSSETPTVVDADGLNLIARTESLAILRENHVITPHPGEFRRLCPDLADLPREEAVLRFVDRSPATLLLKGARTLIGNRTSSMCCIGTGTPAMATGGQGDLLSGVIGACMDANSPSWKAAAFGAWLCGRAAEIALWEGDGSEESTTPSDVALRLGPAFRDWRERNR
ncbi:MAG: NAD(P)H-hydrate dehydratase [Akkermansiaceae bacterium]|nr:NAD(P)H-hydrate dehydratase [Akkermansiaceae bacterium]MCP5542761.1 NAD(P)H-hydrate dehydratase [Akkermansiaceae bacterium]MCP5548821.1 NAD(P)H-hydrate dehydratase [Akkermansiaceae bacterium]